MKLSLFAGIIVGALGVSVLPALASEPLDVSSGPVVSSAPITITMKNDTGVGINYLTWLDAGDKTITPLAPHSSTQIKMYYTSEKILKLSFKKFTVYKARKIYKPGFPFPFTLALPTRTPSNEPVCVLYRLRGNVLKGKKLKGQYGFIDCPVGSSARTSKVQSMGEVDAE